MPTPSALALLFALAVLGLTAATETTAKSGAKKHEHFMPLVAFKCGYRNKFMNAEGRWQDDPSSAASCLHGKYDILKYCKRVYPDKQISNIVEYSHMTRIGHWCREDGSDCHHPFTERPFRCIAGEFVTESLQVPQRCHFSHIAGKDKCNDYKFWNARAEDECAQKKEQDSGQQMRLRSFAILEPCGLSMFRGVEFVCCPRDLEERIEKLVNLEAADSKGKTSKGEEEEEEDEDEEEDDEEYSEEEEEEDKGSQKDKQEQQQDPYYREQPGENEHQRFREAEERLEKKHRKKVTKVITEWSELFERYNKMKEKDPKGAEQYKREMTAKFRKTVAALETENKDQRKQLEELHDERVQTALNEKKRQATHDYRAALAVQVGQANKQNVLRTLKNYIRAEEKDRQHMLNRYRHLLRSDTEAAVSFEPILLHRLRYIDLRINGTLAMLRDFPELEKEVRPVAIAFWKAYRRENTPEALDQNQKGAETAGGSHLLSDEERNERLIKLYKHSFERKNSGSQLALQLHEAVKGAGTKANGALGKTTQRKSMVVALKDVLKEEDTKEEGQAEEEDSDEDQFEEGEESEEKAGVSSTTAKSTTETKKAMKIHVELLSNGKAVEQKEKEEKKAVKLMSSAGSSKKSGQSSSESEEEDGEESDEDEELGDEAQSEYLASNDKKTAEKDRDRDAKRPKQHLRINVEPIVLAPAPGELDSSIAYAKHHRSFSQKTQEELAEMSTVGRWLAQTNLLLGLVALTFAALAIFVLLRRRRSRHPGFIEVDVCTPEERHVAGMQVNGYENPTYAFFEGKQAC